MRLLLLVLLCTACGVRTATRQPLQEEGKLITAEQIAKSGARNAWEALKRGGVHLTMMENGKGEPTALRKRGNSTISLSNTPWVVVDDAPITDFRSLQQIPAHQIATIRVLNGSAGTARYGTGAGNGVIIVQTKN